LKEKLRKLTGAKRQSSVANVVVRTYRRMSEAPSLLITASLEDALCVEERPNVPGTTTERPNWALGLPKTLEEIRDDQVVLGIAGALAKPLSSAA
jgi:4-alpha-glucanotransferase